MASWKQKKSYGEYKTECCVFCGAQSYKKNSLGFPLCKAHENCDDMPTYKCICGDYIDMMVGKYGIYCRCLRCGNQNFQKILEHNRMLNDANKGSKKNVGGNSLDGYYKVQKKSSSPSSPPQSNLFKSSPKKQMSEREKDEYMYGVFLDGLDE